MKTCKDCGKRKPLSDFYTYKNYVFSHCKECNLERGYSWVKNNPEKSRKYQKEWSENNRPKLRASYKRYREKNKPIVALHRKEWNDRERQKIISCLMPKQKGGCAICKKPFGNLQPHFDHNHNTGEIRGLLCRRCNIGLAFIENEKGFAEEAIKYISNYPAKNENIRKYWYGNKVPS